MLQWQHTARDFSLAQVHEAPDPQSNLSHTHSAQLLSHTRKHFYYHVIMSSQRISPGALRPAPHNHLTPTHVPEKRSNPNALMEHRSGAPLPAARIPPVPPAQPATEPNHGNPFTNYKPQLATPPNNNVP